MLTPEKKVAEYIHKLESLLPRFEKGAMGLLLATADEAQYRQMILECLELLGQVFGPSNFYSANLAKAANEGIGSFSGGPTYAGVQAVIAVLRAALTKLEQQHPPDAEANAIELLRVLSAPSRDPGRRVELSGDALAQATGLEAEAVNAAAALLVDSGLAGWQKALGTEPYAFSQLSITSRGRYEFQRLTEAAPSAGATARAVNTVLRPPSPVGSPYGFTDEDWEVVAARRSDAQRLFVVLGHQFESSHYDTAQLKANVRSMFAAAVTQYLAEPDTVPATLEFQPLSAGYGEHLFNEIARDIVSADVAVFDTSDLNPNVMLEIGVALTWGVRVLLIKHEGCDKPPSDISGQTWADYNHSAGTFVDPDHQQKLINMVRRAIRKKGRGGHVG